ncbi:MAG TPA: ATP-binding cassette domain-containing protein, partial [Ktedonobacteraceae bacterium]|nr:ATP-binding cassette domain-containing protein [Ktedonobacteraceae bacterium]
MPIVSVIQVGKSFGAERIFEGVSFQIDEQDRIGLVGPNGAGKTTLLDLLAGRQEADEGNIALARNIRIGYLTQTIDFQPENTLREEMLTVFDQVRAWEQEVGELAQALGDAAAQNDGALHESLMQRYADLQTRFEHAGGYTYEYKVDQVLDGLGFSRELQGSPVSHLSGGQQTRAALGKLLLQEPDLLLLDEPTNHLDLAGIEWLEELLANSPFAVVTVSHDRYFLESTSTQIIELNRLYADGLLRVKGNFSRFLEEKQAYLEAQNRQMESLRNRVRTEIEWLRRGPKARTTKSKARIDAATAMIGQLADMETRTTAGSAGIDFAASQRKTKRLVEFENVGCGVPGSEADPKPIKRLFEGLDFVLTAGTKVGLVGPNGSGK